MRTRTLRQSFCLFYINHIHVANGKPLGHTTSDFLLECFTCE